MLLGVYLFLMSAAIEIGWVLDAGFFFLVGGFVLLTMIFLVVAYWKRQQVHRRPSNYEAGRTLDV